MGVPNDNGNDDDDDDGRREEHFSGAMCVYFSGWVSCAGDVDFDVITTGCAARSRCNPDSCESNDYRLERPAGLSSLAVEVE